MAEPPEDPMSPPRSDDEPLWPIRSVAARTGITAGTLRMWERRYGRPVPVRLPSGHRRYTPDQVRWLVRVSEALALGHRPATVVPAEDKELDAFLQSARHAPAVESADDRRRAEAMAALIEHALVFDDAGVVRILDHAGRTMEPMAFMDGFLVPLLHAVGAAWADGRLEIRHEHFISNLVSDTLVGLRARVGVNQRGAPAVLATLPEEKHGLGLEMAAVVCELNGVPVTFLGLETPANDIVRAAAETGAFAVILSVSPSQAGPETDRNLAELRSDLPDHVELVVGGSRRRGRRRGPRDVVCIEDLGSLERWLLQRRKEDQRVRPRNPQD